MSVTCLYPDHESYPDQEFPPEELGEVWKTAETCTHDWCIEVNGYARQYAAERGHRESLALARDDLDLPYASEAELQTAIYFGLK